MRRVTLLLLLLLAVALCAPAWAVEIAPGLDVTFDLDPSSGGPETTTRRTATLTNTRMDTDPFLIELGSWPAVVDGIPRRVQATFTVIGVPGGYEVTLPMALPLFTSFVPGELAINGVRQPDPPFDDEGYTLTVTVPTATSETEPGICIVQDRVDILVTSLSTAIEVPVSMSLLTSDEGRWKAKVQPVRPKARVHVSVPWRFEQWLRPEDALTNAVMRSSVPPGVIYLSGSAGGYTLATVRDYAAIPGDYDPSSRIVTTLLGDIRRGGWGETSWFVEATEAR